MTDPNEVREHTPSFRYRPAVKPVGDDSLCLGGGLELCATCKRLSPGSRTAAHFLAAPCDSKSCRCYARRRV